MPIEIKITKEIGNYEPKFIGPLTARQFLVFGIAGVSAVFLYKAARTVAPQSIAGYVCLLPAGLGLLFCSNPYGMRFEKFVQSIFVNMFLAPSHRRYRTENSVEALINSLTEADIAMEETAREEKKGKHRQRSSHKEKEASQPQGKEKRSKKKVKQDQKNQKERKSGKNNKNYKLSSKAIR